MPESTCLHIQDRESGPIRVVELPWISVRIGRAAYCEIRLADPDVADEACRLTRRGRSWSLVPCTGAGPVVLEGRPLDAPCPLPFGVPFVMGPYCLTLRHDVTAEPDWELYPATAPFTAIEHRAAEQPAPPPPIAPREPAAAGGRDPEKWRARWKAAEAHLKARTNRLDTAGPRPATPPVAPRVEPGWNPRPAEPPRTTTPAPPPLVTSAWPVVERPAPVAPPPEEPTPPPEPVDEVTPVVEEIVEPLVEAMPEEPPPVVVEPVEETPAVEEVAVEAAPIPVEEPVPLPSPAIERGPKRPRPRERPSAGRRGEPSRRLRSEPVVAEEVEPEPRAAEGPEEVELPSVRDILINHRDGPGPRPAVERRQKPKQAVPTVPQDPGQWTLPGWIALPPIGAFMLGSALIACVLSWWWMADASQSAVLTQRLLASDAAGRKRPLPAEMQPPGGRWVKTTAQHLAHWALYASGVDNDPDHPASGVPGLVTRALEISPLNATARLAMSQLEGPGRDFSGRIRGLGLSRDSVSLAWSARRLLESGRKEAALRLYHRALSAAVEGGLSRSAIPRFDDDPNVRRYFLPAEDVVRDIVAELAEREGLTFVEWSKALPRHPTVLLATARLLHEKGRSEADSLLDELLGDERGGPEAIRDDPRLLAARAEALGLRSRWKDAAEYYRLAIERVDNDLTRRSWWFNLADVAKRFDDEGQRQAAFRAVLAAQTIDDISRRVGEIQRSGGTRPPTVPRFGSAN